MRMDKLTSRFQQALADAQSLAVGRDHNIIEPVHVFTALLDQQGGSTRPLLSQAGVNVPVLRERLKRIYDAGRTLLAGAMEDLAKANGRKMPLPASEVSALLFAVFEGMLIQQIVDDDNAVLDAFFSLAEKLAALKIFG